MARTRTTIRRVDPWSILKFAFVANLVLLGIQLLAGIVVWYVIQRLELIQTVCELAATVGFEECGVDGGALFDTVLVLGLLGVVIQTGILVFLTFLANLIFDLTGGIVVTLEDDRAPAGASRNRAGVGARSRAGASSGALAGASSSGASSRGSSRGVPAGSTAPSGGSGQGSGATTSTQRRTPGAASTDSATKGSDSGGASADRDGAGPDRDDDTLFGSS